MTRRHPSGGVALDAPRTEVQKLLSSAIERSQAARASTGRILSGWASTGGKDRMGDIISPKGIAWQLPIPILRQHAPASPVGRVLSLRASDRGIWMTCEISRGIGEADLLWEQIESGSVNYWSIGFRAVKMEPIAGGGIRFEAAELLEVSAVAVAANRDCKIEMGGSQ
jgi:HK97 family phage prohead protease